MEITLEGPPAVAIGLCIISLGLLPLTLWFTSKRFKVIWVILCVTAATLFYHLSASMQ